MDRTAHWEEIYTRTSPLQVSWYQANPRQSLAMIKQAAPDRRAPIIDIGGGTSVLVDMLLDEHYHSITVLDIAPTALTVAQARLGERATLVTWVAADITAVALPAHTYALWHDRAVFHFLTQADDRRRYVAVLRQALRPDGHLIMATFAADGPDRCSGLDVVRYTPATLAQELGSDFQLIDQVYEAHQAPGGTIQQFMYCYFSLNGCPADRIAR
ncbi:MAG: class I SAM-dependent methyltransferase [Mycobacterium sp.]